MGQHEWRAKKRATQIGILLRTAYVSICSVANKIAFYEASKCHDPPESPRRAIIPLLIDLFLTYSRVTTLVSQPQSLSRVAFVSYCLYNALF